MVTLPIITLDTTLADLYRRASPKNENKRIGQVVCGTNSGMSLTPDFPRNVKYLYQDSPFNNVSKKKLTEENGTLQRSLAMKYLSLVPQRDAFISGDTAVVLFNTGQSREQKAHDEQEAERTLEVLKPEQRPQLVFCPGPAEIPVEERGIDLLACKLDLDALEKYPLTISLDTHWYLNSKAALAKSGLPTPRCEIIELEGYSQAAKACCKICRDGDALFITAQCEGERGKWLQKEMDRILAKIASYPVPFVLKNQQTFGGAGTYVINNEKERDDLVKEFSNELLRKLLSQVTESNHHLNPATILLSDLVADPVGDYGLTFFVTDSGEAIFLAVSEQMIDSDRAWIGSTINYQHQQQLEKKFSAIMQDIATWLHKHGYYGPVGADILETANEAAVNGNTRKTDSQNFHIVDLNVRTSGSLCLPLLRSHFESRGLKSASSFGVTVKATRDDFLSQWREGFESGRMCILSWYEDKDGGVSIADVALGSETAEGLQSEMKNVRAATDDVKF